MKLLLLLMITCFLGAPSAIAKKIKFQVENDLETSADDEYEITDQLLKTMAGLASDVRDQHPKPHGCVDGANLTVDYSEPTFKLPNGQIRKLDIGIFARKGETHKVKLRVSSGSPSITASDLDGGPQGLALLIELKEDLAAKVFRFDGVGGYFATEFGVSEIYSKLLDPSVFYTNQSIPLISGGTDDRQHVEWNDDRNVREFFANSAKDYVDFLEFQKQSGLAAKQIIMSSPEALAAIKAGQSPMVPSVKAAIAAKAKELLVALYIKPTTTKRFAAGALLQRLGATTTKDILNKEFDSFLPYLYGRDDQGNHQAVKYVLRPSQETWVDPITLKVPQGVDSTSPNVIGQWLKYHVANQPTKYDVMVQFYVKGGENWPDLEETTKPWPAKLESSKDYSPFVKVGSLNIPQNAAFLDSKICETMNLNPGHSLAEHYPISGPQRVRVPIYIVDANVRNALQVKKNGG